MQMTTQNIPVQIGPARLELARRAFKEFYAQCFWSSDPTLIVEEADIPWIMRNLRLHGGHEGYRIVSELCR